MLERTERHLPFNVDAEQCVLGSIIIDPEAITLVADWLRAEDFYRDSHRIIYRAILRLYERHEPADTMTLGDELERRGQVESIGGSAYLSELTYRVPTSGNIEHYARIVVRHATHRRLIHAAGQIAALAYEGDEQALEKAGQLLAQVDSPYKQHGFTTMEQLMTNYMQELEFLHANRGAITGVSTGYKGLDATSNGLHASDLILLAARPSVGKSALALGITYHAARCGKPVAVFTLEMGEESLARRLMAIETKIDLQRLGSGWIADDEWERVVSAVGNLSRLPIYINDTAGNPVKSMRNQLRRLTASHGPMGLIVVDYLGLIEPDTEEEKRASLVQQISAISRGLKGLAREFKVPVLALCQLSRAVEQRENKRPRLSDLRDSGSLEQDADMVWLLYRDDYYAMLEHRESNAPGIAELIIAKHRNGPTGNIRLYYRADQTMFYDLDSQEAQQ